MSSSNGSHGGNNNDNDPTAVALKALTEKEDPTVKDLIPLLVSMHGTTQSSLQNMQGTLQNMQGQLHVISQTLNPYTNPVLRSAPVITGGGGLFSSDKNGIFTWIKFPNNNLVAIGAAHTALRFKTEAVLPEKCGNLVFIALPPEVLKLGVKSVFFVDTALFKNPLPTELDVCVLELNNKPSDSEVTTSFTPVALVGVHSFTSSNVIGKSNGSFVSSFGGGVEIKKDSNSGLGKVEFLLQAGEPGDSGTLLHVQDTDGKHSPIAIFTGNNQPSPAHQRRGCACLIPSQEYFKSRLAVKDPASIERVFITHKGGGVMLGVEPQQDNAVLLRAGNGDTVSGVFVDSPNQIDYIGDIDIALMNKLGVSNGDEPSVFE